MFLASVIFKLTWTNCYAAGRAHCRVRVNSPSPGSEIKTIHFMYVGYVLVSEMILHLSHTYARTVPPIDTKNMRGKGGREFFDFYTNLEPGKIVSSSIRIKIEDRVN